MKVATKSGDINRTVEKLLAAQVVTVDVTLPSVAGQYVRIEHGLGRVPRGYSVALQPPGIVFSHGYDPTAINALAWTSTEIYVIFSIGGINLTIAVY